MENLVHTDAVFHLRENERTIAAHFFGVAFHDFSDPPQRPRRDRFC